MRGQWTRNSAEHHLKSRDLEPWGTPSWRSSFLLRLSFLMGIFMQNNLFHMRENGPSWLLYSSGSLMWATVHIIYNYMIPKQGGVIQMTNEDGPG